LAVSGLHGVGDTRGMVDAQIIQQHDVAGSQGRHKDPTNEHVKCRSYDFI